MGSSFIGRQILECRIVFDHQAESTCPSGAGLVNLKQVYAALSRRFLRPALFPSIFRPRYRTLRPRWATLQGAATYSGLSKRLLEIAAGEGHIRMAHVKRGSDKTRGRRLVDLRSLDAWIEKWVGQ